jgi:hypothetical protein
MSYLKKKGASVWISAVLYFGIGIVILTLVLTLGMPVIDRMRDKNIAVQTKEVFHNLDSTIRAVAKEGPGSQRVSNVEIKKGTLSVDNETDEIIWGFETTAVLSEPGESAQEGAITLLTNGSAVADVEKFLLTYSLDYHCKIDIVADGSLSGITGSTRLVISNGGTSMADCGEGATRFEEVPKVKIKTITIS